ncbi:MAG: sensor histidine kinase [Actinophytocola sp.]|uniref:sensor histidine kinase n=1 Tax=Actinophytocola sp. TaxID=1872138 RepID=UPI00132A2F69|nr:histidine kinase [Actinophytocola sp.]MPZ80361.1 sensor histidine kinase [Actinophytocola sp.]
MRTAGRLGIGTSDVLLTAALLVVILFAVLVLPRHWIDGEPIDALGLALLVLSALPVLVRRRYPVVALLSCVLVEIVYHALGYAHEAGLPVAVVLIYTVSVGTSRVATLVVLGVTSLALLLTVGLKQDGPPGVEVISPLGWFVVAAVGGQAVRIHRAFLAESTERRVAEERLRIARDLHDVLAHHIVVINSHAGVAAHLLDERGDDPTLAPITRSLHTVADASSGVLAELRTTLDVLRGNETDADRQPAPGLDGLAGLASVTGEVGVAVDVDVRGTRRPLASAVEVTLYRITQEALTNVVRHARAQRARVVLEYGTDQVRLEVTDDGHGADGTGGGYGIVGMTERAHAVGGRLDTGNGPAGGFRVAVTVPTGMPTGAPTGAPAGGAR